MGEVSCNVWANNVHVGLAKKMNQGCHPAKQEMTSKGLDWLRHELVFLNLEKKINSDRKQMNGKYTEIK